MYDTALEDGTAHIEGQVDSDLTIAPYHYVVERRQTMIITSAFKLDDQELSRISREDSTGGHVVSANTSSPVIHIVHSGASTASPSIKRLSTQSKTLAAGVRPSQSRDSWSSSAPPSPCSSKKSPPPVPMRQRKKIFFYNREDPHYGFTNFSPHPVVYDGLEYPTSEHLFQSFKFQEHRPLLAEHIRLFSDRPSVALSEARRFQPEVRRDWMNINLAMMDEALWHKFNQHASLKAELLATGDAELIEDSDKDSFWGVGANRQGRNELGKALVRLRERLRSDMKHTV